MVMIKPHTITISPVNQATLSNGVLGNPAPGTASSAIRCLCTPMQPQEAYARFGATLINPWKVLMEVGDAVTHASPNALVEFDGRQYWQKGAAEILNNGDPADCAVVLMSENQYPLEG